MAGTYTVTQINSYIKNMFRQDFVLSRVSVRGEISNCKYHTSGHIYFTLKDQNGTLSAVMFAGQAKGLRFRLEDGMQVTAKGRIDVYERDGKYQFYAAEIVRDGVGDLYLRFEQLKARFEEMGYFSNEYKRPIPAFSRKIGIVTASTGAAIHDIMNIAHRRNPYVSLILYPALVQGADAAASIVRGIEILDKMGLDCLIVGRGGGSIEDLWAFNEAVVAEAVFNARTPIISAVGHETDFTITDFVADLRAPTPSAAAELAVADIRLVEQRIAAYVAALGSALEARVSDGRLRLSKYAMQLKFLNPISQVHEKRQYLAHIQERMSAAIEQQMQERRHRLELYASRLNGSSPLQKLNQGYSYVENDRGKPIHSTKEVQSGEVLTLYMQDGRIKAQAMEVTHGKITDA